MTKESENSSIGNSGSDIAAVAALTIDVVSDVVCPWCFVGKRQLEKALQMRLEKYPDEAPPVVRWHPFQLNPDMPAQGMSRTDYLQAKFGDPTGGAGYESVREAAADAGLELALDKIERQPNTLHAHAMVAMAQDKAQDDIVEGLFDAYFMQGRDLSDESVLIELGRATQMPETIIESALSDESVIDAVTRADSHAREIGVNGVPFFIFNQRLAVSGAAGADTLLAASEKAVSDAAAGDNAANDANTGENPDPTT